MTSEQWRIFFTIASRHIPHTLKSQPSKDMDALAPICRPSHCAWTTFERLAFDTMYWTGTLPEEDDLQREHLRDGVAWRQPFLYTEIAHLILPSRYLEDSYADAVYTQWTHEQDIAGLSQLLSEMEIPHRLYPTFLELKLY